MSYEIPSELQYHERIVFGLTMPQLAWALLFGMSLGRQEGGHPSAV